MLQNSHFYILQSLHSTDGTIEATLRINAEHPVFNGHFPEQPVVPGVCEVQIIKEITAQVLQSELLLSKASTIKFLNFIHPLTTGVLTATVQYKINGNEITFHAIMQDTEREYLKLSGTFTMQCANISAGKVCVIIPTYNNAKTLPGVIDGVLQHHLPVMVVNDGSTDDTELVLSRYPSLQVIRYAGNRGKGFALQQGFHHALQQGFDYAVTIDSDGQHHPSDIPLFLQKLRETGECMILGERNMRGDGIPLKSNFGRRFSNFWFFVETFNKSNDTQTGFRLYPLQALSKLCLFTHRFEFEIESLVRIAWENVPVVSVPVRVTYFSGEEKVSHFRPAKDFFRISLLNTLLVLMGYCYFIPRMLWKQWRKKNAKAIMQSLLAPAESNLRKSAAIGFGLFMGIVPIWGFQMITAVALAFPLRLNKLLVLLGSNISLPPMIPFIIYGSLWCGKLVLQNDDLVTFSGDLTIHHACEAVGQYLIGSCILAVVTGLLGFVLSWLILHLTRKPRVI